MSIGLSNKPYHTPQCSASDVFIPGYHSVPDASQTITSSQLYHEFAVPQHPGEIQAGSDATVILSMTDQA